MKQFVRYLKKQAERIFQEIKTTVDLTLEGQEERIGALTVLAVLDLMLAYILAILFVGIWAGDCTPWGIIAACMTPEYQFPYLVYILIRLILFGLLYHFLRKSLVETEDRNFTLSEANTYGNAREINRDELGEVAEIASMEEVMGTVLGQLDRTEKHLIGTKPGGVSNGNMAIFGASGSGKSFSFVKPFIVQAIRRGESVLVTDSKGEIWADTVELARRHGYIVRRIDLKNPEVSNGWNVLKELRNDDVRALIFAQTVMMNTGNLQDPHFAAEQSLLKALCLYQERSPFVTEETKTFYNAYAMLSMDPKDLDATFAAAKADPKMRVACDAYDDFVRGSEKLKGNVITNLRGRLQILASTPIQNLTSITDIDLSLPGQKRCIYYIAVSDQHQTMKFLSSLFFNFAYLDLSDFADKQKSRRLPITVNFLMEEFYSSVGFLPNLSQYLATCRSRAINFMLILQDMGQLNEIYGESVTSSILSNCATHMCLGFNDKVTAEYFEWRAGEATIQVKTEQHQAVDPLMALGLRHSTGDGRRAYWTSNELMKMKARKRCFVVWQSYDCLMPHTVGINRYIEYQKGRMPVIEPEVHIPLQNDEAKQFLQDAEDLRVQAYSRWLSLGGNPWQDYLTPAPPPDGPASGSDLPGIIPYNDLESMALAYADPENRDSQDTIWTYVANFYENNIQFPSAAPAHDPDTTNNSDIPPDDEFDFEDDFEDEDFDDDFEDEDFGDTPTPTEPYLYVLPEDLFSDWLPEIKSKDVTPKSDYTEDSMAASGDDTEGADQPPSEKPTGVKPEEMTESTPTIQMDQNEQPRSTQDAPAPAPPFEKDAAVFRQTDQGNSETESAPSEKAASASIPDKPSDAAPQDNDCGNQKQQTQDPAPLPKDTDRSDPGSTNLDTGSNPPASSQLRKSPDLRKPTTTQSNIAMDVGAPGKRNKGKKKHEDPNRQKGHLSAGRSLQEISGYERRYH